MFRRGGGRSRRGGAPERNYPQRRVSEADARRERLLTDEVRSPSPRLTVTQDADSVTITDDHAHARTFHPNGREEVAQLAADLPVVLIARWEADHLTVLYEVSEGRQIRCDYSRPAGTTQFVVTAQFIERGQGDSVRRVYTPASDSQASPAPAVAPPAQSAPAAPGQPPPGSVPAAGNAGAFDQRPGAELRGLTTLGLVVEGLGGQSATCGLDQRAIEDQVAAHLKTAGLTVRRNSDEDTYVYVNVMTATGPNGLCVSRYDVSLTSHTTARLSYQQTPVLVEVSLLHKGGIAGGGPATHGADVLKAVLGYVDEFTARIKDASR
jgi:hypothetical protein